MTLLGPFSVRTGPCRRGRPGPRLRGLCDLMMRLPCGASNRPGVLDEKSSRPLSVRMPWKKTLMTDSNEFGRRPPGLRRTSSGVMSSWIEAERTSPGGGRDRRRPGSSPRGGRLRG
ncbi:MAG: hypothetical protein MZV64_22875 [Ignavibacteriales bacterium]|nr:hypothetical protein [Ignavibacteriales bacterium]